MEEKKKRGRPSIVKGESLFKLSIRVTEKNYQQIVDTARKNKKPINDICRDIINEYLKNRQITTTSSSNSSERKGPFHSSTICLKESVKKQIEDLAWGERKTQNDIFNEALAQYLQKLEQEEEK